jgi:cell division protein FtsX
MTLTLLTICIFVVINFFHQMPLQLIFNKKLISKPIIKDTASEESIQDMVANLQSQSQISQVDYVDKQKALELFQRGVNFSDKVKELLATKIILCRAASILK